MPSSYRDFKDEIKNHIYNKYPKDIKILDIGPGLGTYAQLLFDYKNIDCVEIYKPYIGQYNLDSQYRQVFNMNIMDFDFEYYDLIIMGDILEHLTIDDSIKLLNKIINKCDDIIISVPYLADFNHLYDNEPNKNELHIQVDLTEEVMKNRYPILKKLWSNDRMGIFDKNKPINELILMDTFVDLIKDNIKFNNTLTIVEVGSLNGNDSMFLKKSFPNSNVYTIEGLPDNYEKYLKDNKEINAFNVVICDYNGLIDFYVKNTNGIHSIHNRGDNLGTTVIKVPCIRFDKFCKKNNIDKIDILKIDVEGATYEVLKGMGKTLSNVKIMHIETEFYPFFENQKLHKEVEDILIKNNFELLKITFNDISDGKYQSDSVWINKKYKNQKDLAITVYLDDNSNIIDEFYWLYKSFIYSGNYKNSDLVVFCNPSVISKLDSSIISDKNVILIPSEPATKVDSLWTEYPWINSVYYFMTKEVEILLNYKYTLSTDCDTFVTKNLIDFRPLSYVFGLGTYMKDKYARDKVVEFIERYNLKYNFIHNVGSSLLFLSQEVINFRKFQYDISKHLKINEFPENSGQWGSWFYGVITMYANEIAANQLGGPNIRTNILDSFSMGAGEIGNFFYHIHAFPTEQFFSKHKFRNGEYKNINVDELNINLVNNYCLYIASKSIEEIKKISNYQ